MQEDPRAVGGGVAGEGVVVAPPAPVYHAVVVASYYDVYRGTCEVRDTYDQYNNFVYRQTVCYGR